MHQRDFMLLYGPADGRGLHCHACSGKPCLAQADCCTASLFVSHVVAAMLDSHVSFPLSAEHVSPRQGLTTSRLQFVSRLCLPQLQHSMRCFQCLHSAQHVASHYPKPQIARATGSPASTAYVALRSAHCSSMQQMCLCRLVRWNHGCAACISAMLPSMQQAYHCMLSYPRP